MVETSVTKLIEIVRKSSQKGDSTLWDTIDKIFIKFTELYLNYNINMNKVSICMSCTRLLYKLNDLLRKLILAL